MSDVLQGALASGAFGLLILIFTRYFNAQDRRQENDARLKERAQEIEARARERREDAQEWQRRELFHKRLDALQLGQYWLNRIAAQRYRGNREELGKLVRDANEWLDHDSVYLVGAGAPQSKLYHVFHWVQIDSDIDAEHTYQNAVKEASEELQRVNESLLSVEAIND